jgi:hypothetical protein
VRTLHLKLSQATSTKGNLQATAELYGVFPRSDLHRAEADVALTVELLNAIIARYGLDVVAAHIEANPSVAMSLIRNLPAPSQESSAPVTAQETEKPKRVAKPKQATLLVSEFAKGKQFVSMEMLAEALNMETKTLSFEVGKAIDERLVSPSTFAVESVQEWLADELIELDVQTLTQGKLKPIFDALLPSAPGGAMDYIQLRIALLKAGQTWTTLKPL